MPSVSKAQRRYMAIAEHHPEELKGPKPNLSYSQLHDFSVGSEQGKPEHVAPHKSHPGKNLGKHLGKGFNK